MKSLLFLLAIPFLATCALFQEPSPIPAENRPLAQQELKAHLPKEVGRCLSALGVMKGVNLLAQPLIDDDVLEHYFYDCLQNESDDRIRERVKAMIGNFLGKVANLTECYYQAGMLHERLKYDLSATSSNALSEDQIKEQIDEFLSICSSGLGNSKI